MDVANQKARHERQPESYPLPFPAMTTKRSTHDELFLFVDSSTMPHKVGFRSRRISLVMIVLFTPYFCKTIDTDNRHHQKTPFSVSKKKFGGGK